MRRVSIILAVAVVLSGCNPLATKGTVPPPPPGGGLVDPKEYPDYIAAWNRDGTSIAGYVPKSCLFPTPGIGRQEDENCPVFADDLLTLVGHMVAGRGFVPLGTDPADVPPFPVQAGPSTGP